MLKNYQNIFQNILDKLYVFSYTQNNHREWNKISDNLVIEVIQFGEALVLLQSISSISVYVHIYVYIYS